MMLALLLQAAPLAAVPTITLSEAEAMSPAALAARLLADREHGTVVHAKINGGGFTWPSVKRVRLLEQMTPFDAKFCRRHGYTLEMESSDPAANPWSQAAPTHPVKVEVHDWLWAPPTGAATAAACAAAPEHVGFSDGGLGLQQAANLVEQARSAFAPTTGSAGFTVSCRSERDACGKDPRKTLAAINWSALALVEQVSMTGSYVGDPKPPDGPPGPSSIRFTFPYAADGGATWMLTVDRAPHITAVRMDARWVVYH